MQNFKRLRYWSFFLILLSAYQLSYDFSFQNQYEQKQIEFYLRVDTFLAFVSVFLLIFTSISHPKSENDLKWYHKLVLYIYLFFHINWGASVSAIESATSEGFPTFLIGVFSAATLFFTGGLTFGLILITSLFTIYGVNVYLHYDVAKLLSNYQLLIMLIIIAWIVSRVILMTRMNTYIATVKLTEANNTLDIKVKERTEELSNSNQLLIKEIKERKKYERQLEVAIKRAEEADRLKTIFLANMSHEIRTPLNGILGFSVLLNRENVSKERKDRYTEIILNSGQQLLRIIDDILDISLIESNQLKINNTGFNLNDKLNEVIESFNSYKKTTDKDHIEFTYSFSLEKPNDYIISDPFRLQQVINNLLKNAFKFTFEGKVEFGYKVLNTDLLFYVSDTGIGIDYDKREIIFERFRQGEESLKRTFSGTGLGLSICKGIVEHMGGKIWIDDSFVNGSRFYFSIPYKKLAPNEAIVSEKENVNG